MCSAKRLHDYGKLYRSSENYAVASPRSASEVQALIARARRTGKALRVRASGHTFSGATLPRQGELLLRTDRIDHYRFEQPGTITVGAGAIAWDVRDFVAAHGLRMPVYNGGWAGPTIGGYICAGGMGLRVPPQERYQAVDPISGRAVPVAALTSRSISELHGGFWEHVLSVTLIDGNGRIREIVETDENFPWLFGSFGQLGVLFEAKLRLLVDADAPDAYPIGRSGRIPRVQTDDPADNDTPPAPGGQNLLFWFSYLVSAEQEAAAWRELGAWADRHAAFLHPQGGWVGPEIGGTPIGYRYQVTFKRFNPPLLYPNDEDFVLMGLMGLIAGVGLPAVDSKVMEIEREFIEIARNNGFRLYPQAENIGLNLDYRAYYGEEIFSAFARLKKAFDPDGLINPGVVFPSATPPPERTSQARLTAAMFARLIGSPA